jgi:hypothetical protein
MLRRRLYTRKAIDHINSPDWNPLLGTGLQRLAGVANDKIPETLEVWDANWQAWRPARELADRPVHNAFLNVLGEFGVLGAGCLVGILLSLVAAARRAASMARLRGLAFDRDLLVAGLAAGVTMVAQGAFHNTDTVHQVTAMFWAYAGILVGHPAVFAYRRGSLTEAAHEPRGAVSEQHDAIGTG